MPIRYQAITKNNVYKIVWHPETTSKVNDINYIIDDIINIMKLQ